MEHGTRKNSLAWEKVYKTTNFGNRYPTDGLVSLYHHFVKDKMEALERPAKILDFGCSHGANAKFLPVRDLTYMVLTYQRMPLLIVSKRWGLTAESSEPVMFWEKAYLLKICLALSLT